MLKTCSMWVWLLLNWFSDGIMHIHTLHAFFTLNYAYTWGTCMILCKTTTKKLRGIGELWRQHVLSYEGTLSKASRSFHQGFNHFWQSLNSKDYGLTSHYWSTETWIICSTLMVRRYWKPYSYEVISLKNKF